MVVAGVQLAIPEGLGQIDEVGVLRRLPETGEGGHRVDEKGDQE